MKRFMLAAAVLTLLGGQSLAGADHTTDPPTFTGTVAQSAPSLGSVGIPPEAGGGRVELGLASRTQVSAACDSSHADNGLDGIWFDLVGYDGHEGRLTPADASTQDFDVSFFGNNDPENPCKALGSAGMGEEFTGTGAGTCDVRPTWCTQFGDGIEETDDVNPATQNANKIPAGTTHVFVRYYAGPPDGSFTLEILNGLL